MRNINLYIIFLVVTNIIAGCYDNVLEENGQCADSGILGVDGSTSRAECIDIPAITSQMMTIYKPSGERYLNDHTIFKDDYDRIHVIGIEGYGAGNPWAETSLLHAFSPSNDLTQWQELPSALETIKPEVTLWAPHVFRSESQFLMFYYSGDGYVRKAYSNDENLETWNRTGSALLSGRDPMIFWHAKQNQWLLYATSTSDDEQSSHSIITIRTSKDLTNWSDTATALRDPNQPSVDWGELESPYVVELENGSTQCYYLFTTFTDSANGSYNRTLVFRSNTPMSFEWNPIVELRAHGAEIIRIGDDWFISSCGWTKRIGENMRGLSIARLQWTRY